MSLLRVGRHCVCCLKELPLNQRMDACFCPPPKVANEPRRKKTKKPPPSACWRLWTLKRLTIRRLSIPMEELAKALSRCAKAAVWYRVQGIIDDKAWMFPATDRPTLRFDGFTRQTAGFLVHPFEPPVVPKAGSYAFTFYDSQGNPVETPTDCYEFLIEPVISVGTETGLLLRDFRK